MKFYIILFLLLVSCNIFAQEIDDIETDRPDQTETSNTVPRGFLQVENGFTYERDVWTNEDTYNPLITPLRKNIYEFYTPGILIRYGVSKIFELRLSGELTSILTTQIVDEHTISSSPKQSSWDWGFSSITLATKIKLFDEKKARPETAFIFGLAIPFDTKSIFQTEYVSPSFRFSCSHTLSKRFSLGYNLGGEWENNKDNSTSTGIYTLTVGVDIINKLGGYVELYGFLTQDEKPDHRFDAGFTYLIRKNIPLDVSGGVGITEVSPDYFIGAGLSFRIPR